MDIKTAIRQYVKALRQKYIDAEGHYADFEIQFGRTYVKIISKSSMVGGRSAWGFIVMNVPKGKEHLHKGDLLKAASWNAPATNVARGNILKGTDMTQWTGPVYVTSKGRPNPKYSQMHIGLLPRPKVSNPFELS
jgi:hypothetical protein